MYQLMTWCTSDGDSWNLIDEAGNHLYEVKYLPDDTLVVSHGSGEGAVEIGHVESVTRARHLAEWHRLNQALNREDL